MDRFTNYYIRSELERLNFGNLMDFVGIIMNQLDGFNSDEST